MSKSVIINSVIAGLVVWFVTKNLNGNSAPVGVAPTAAAPSRSGSTRDVEDRLKDAATTRLVGLIGSLGTEQTSETYA